MVQSVLYFDGRARPDWFANELVAVNCEYKEIIKSDWIWDWLRIARKRLTIYYFCFLVLDTHCLLLLLGRFYFFLHKILLWGPSTEYEIRVVLQHNHRCHYHPNDQIHSCHSAVIFLLLSFFRFSPIGDEIDWILQFNATDRHREVEETERQLWEPCKQLINVVHWFWLGSLLQLHRDTLEESEFGICFRFLLSRIHSDYNFWWISVNLPSTIKRSQHIVRVSAGVLHATIVTTFEFVIHY